MPSFAKALSSDYQNAVFKLNAAARYSPFKNPEFIHQTVANAATRVAPLALNAVTGIPPWLSRPFINKFSNQTKRDRAYKLWLSRRNKYKRGRRSNNYIHYQTSRYMPYRRNYKRRYGGRRRRFGGRRRRTRMRGRYNKARSRFYKRRNYQRGMLRGLTGPNCVPKRLFCRLQRKVFFHYDSDPTDSLANFIEVLASTDLSFGTSGIDATIATSTTLPAIFPVLTDFFDQVRTYKLSWNLKWFPSIQNSATFADSHGYAMRMVPYDDDASIPGKPANADTLHDAMLNRAALKILPRWYGDANNPAITLNSVPRTLRFKGSFNTATRVASVSNSRDYFNDEAHANLITGSIGSRVIAAPTTATEGRIALQVWPMSSSWTANELWSGTLVGTITQHTFWSKSNPEFEFDDTQL